MCFAVCIEPFPCNVQMKYKLGLFRLQLFSISNSNIIFELTAYQKINILESQGTLFPTSGSQHP